MAKLKNPELTRAFINGNGNGNGNKGNINSENIDTSLLYNRSPNPGIQEETFNEDVVLAQRGYKGPFDPRLPSVNLPNVSAESIAKDVLQAKKTFGNNRVQTQKIDAFKRALGIKNGSIPPIPTDTPKESFGFIGDTDTPAGRKSTPPSQPSSNPINVLKNEVSEFMDRTGVAIADFNAVEFVKSIAEKYPSLGIEYRPDEPDNSEGNIKAIESFIKQYGPPLGISLDPPPSLAPSAKQGFASTEDKDDTPPDLSLFTEQEQAAFKLGAKAGEQLSEIDIDPGKEWNTLWDTIFQADEPLLRGLGKGVDSLKTLATKFMKHENITGVSINEALTHIKKNYNKFIEWANDTSLNEEQQRILAIKAEKDKADRIAYQEREINLPSPDIPALENPIGSLLDSIQIAEGPDAIVPFGQTWNDDFKRRIALGETISIAEAKEATIKYLRRHIQRWQAGGTRKDVDKAEERGLIGANPNKTPAIQDGKWNLDFLKWFAEIYAPTHPSVYDDLSDAEKAKNKNWLNNVINNLDPTTTPSEQIEEQPVQKSFKSVIGAGVSSRFKQRIMGAKIDPKFKLKIDNLSKEPSFNEGPSAIISIDGHVVRYDNGTFGAIMPTHEIVGNLSESSAHFHAAAAWRESQVLAQGGAKYNTAGDIANFIIGHGPRPLETAQKMFVGNTTLVGKIGEYNRLLQSQKHLYHNIRFPQGEERNITREDVSNYRIIQESIAASTPLSQELQKFKNGDKYTVIAQLDKDAKENTEQLESIEKFWEGYRKHFPTNDAPYRGADAAFDIISKNEGLLAATMYALKNHKGKYAKEGLKSVGYTIALTVGNVPVQLGVLTALVQGTQEEAIKEWVDNNPDKELTPEILDRIEWWTTWSVVAEKISAGYLMKVIGKVPGVGQLPWIAGVGEKLALTVPNSVRSLVSLSAGALGEGGQGFISEATSQIAQEGELTSADKLAKATISELLGVATIAPTVAAIGVTTKVGGAVVGKMTEPTTAEKAATQEKQERENLEANIKNYDEQLEKIEIQKKASPENSLKLETLNTQLDDLNAAKAEIEDTLKETTTLPKHFAKLETKNTLLKKLFKQYESRIKNGDLTVEQALEEIESIVEAQITTKTEEKVAVEKQLPEQFKFGDTYASTPTHAELAGVNAALKSVNVDRDTAIKAIEKAVHKDLTKEKKKELIEEAKQRAKDQIAALTKRQQELTALLEQPANKDILKAHEKVLRQRKKTDETKIKNQSYRRDPSSGKLVDKDQASADAKSIVISKLSDGEVEARITMIMETRKQATKDRETMPVDEKFRIGDIVTILDTEDPALKDSQGFIIEEVFGIQERDGKRHVKLKGVDETIPIDQIGLATRPDISKGYTGQLAELVAQDLTDEQKILVRKFFDTEIEALKTLLGKSKRVLGSSEDSFTETDKLEVEALEKRVAALEENATATEADRKFWKDLLEQKRIQRKRAGKNETIDKTLSDVHGEILEGTEAKWKGLYSYYQDIVKAYEDYKDDTDVRDQRIAVIRSHMETHAANLNDKLAAFQVAKGLSLKPGTVAAVVGTRISDTSRKMNYEVVTDSVKAIEEAQKNGEYKGKRAYITRIDDKSTNLINTLEKEANYGNFIMGVVRGYEKTSMARKYENQAFILEENEKVLKKLEEVRNILGRPIVPITPESIASMTIDRSGKTPISVLKTQLDQVLERGTKLSKKEERTEDEENELKELRTRYLELVAQIKKQEEEADKKPEQLDLFPEGTLPKGTTPVSDEAPESPPPVTKPPGKDEKGYQEEFDFDEESEPDTTLFRKGEQLKLFPNFIEGAAKAYKRVITPELIAKLKDAAGNLTNQLGLAGAYFIDLVQVGAKNQGLDEAHINTLQHTDFDTEEALTTALMKLGVTEASAEGLAANYTHFKKRYENILYKELARTDIVEWLIDGVIQTSKNNDQIKKDGPFEIDEDYLHVDLVEKEDGTFTYTYATKGKHTKLIGIDKPVLTSQLLNAKNFALQEPLSILLQEDLDNKNNQGKLPDQIVFTLMLTAMTFRQQHPNNNRWGDQEFGKGAFLYKGRSQKLTTVEDDQVSGLGYGYHDVSGDMGRDAIKLLELSAKKINKEKLQKKEDKYNRLLEKASKITEEKELKEAEAEARKYKLTAEESRILNSPLTQAGIDLYFEQLGPALGMMAIEIAQGTVDDNGAYFRVEKHEWDFEDYREDRTFNNAPTRHPISSNPEIRKKYPEGRPIPEEEQKRYKHIKVKEGSRISEAGNIALNEIVKVTGTDINTSPGPLQTPAKVAKRIKGTFTSVGEEVNRLLKKAQKVVWKKSQSMDIVDDIREHESVLHELMGVEELYKKDAEGEYILNEKGEKVGKFHEVEMKSRESSNRDKLDTLEELLAANDRKELNAFYIAYQLQNHHRLMQLGRINPQQSKVTRALVNAWKSRQYSKKNLHNFKLGVAQSFSVKVTKQELLDSEREFDEIIKNPYILEAVEALQRINAAKELIKADANDKKAIKSKKRAAEDFAIAISKVKRETAFKEANLTILNGIAALSQYMTVEAIVKTKAGLPNKQFKKKNNFKIAKINSTFTSDISGEIDGISNGWAQNVYQFPMWEEAELIKRNKQVGNNFNGEAHDPTQPGVYEDLIKYIQEGMSAEVAWEWHKDNNWKEDFPTERVGKYSNEDTFKAKYNELNTALNIVYPDFTISESLRDVAKYPFIMSMYGSGMTRIANDVSKDIVKAIYTRVGTIQNEYESFKDTKYISGTGLSADRKEYLKGYDVLTKEDYERKVIIPFMNSLKVLGAFDQTKTRSKSKRPVNYDTFLSALKSGNAFDKYFDQQQLMARLSTTIAPRFNSGLNKLLGPTKEPRDTIVEMGEMLHWTFMTHYEEAYEKKLAEVNEEYTPDKTVVNVTHKNRTWIVSKKPDGTFDISSTKPDGTVDKKVTWVATNRDRIAINKEAEKEFSKQKPKLRTILTKQELYDLITEATGELVKLYPQIAGPLSKIGENGEILGGIDLSATEFATQSKDSTNIRTEEVQISFIDIVTGNKTTSRSVPSQLAFIAPGVAALIRQIINMDAVIMTQTMNGNPDIILDETGERWAGDVEVLPIHDGYVASPDQLSILGEVYGKGYQLYNQKHNIIDETYKQVLKVFNATRLKDERDERNLKLSKKDRAAIKKAEKQTAKAIELLKILRPGISYEWKNGVETTKYTPAARKAAEKLNKLVTEHDLDPEKIKMNFTNASNAKKTLTRMDKIKMSIYTSSGLNNNKQKKWERKITFNDLEKKFARVTDEVNTARAKRDSIVSEAGTMNIQQMFWPSVNQLLHKGKTWFDATGTAIQAAFAKGGAHIRVENEKKKRKTKNRKGKERRGEKFKKDHAKQEEMFPEYTDYIKDVRETTKKEVKKRRLHSLDGLPKDVKETEEMDDITASSVRLLFNKFSEFSSGYYNNKEDMDDHVSTLSQVLNILADGFESTRGIHLTWEQIDGVTQGMMEYELDSTGMKVSTSRQDTPSTRNGQSPQEIYTHEMVHAMTVVAIDEVPEIADRLEALFTQVEDSLNKDFGEGMGWKVFRPKGTKPTDLASSEEVFMSRKLYRHAFQTKEENRLHEFLAFALTNQQLVSHMKQLDRTKRTDFIGQLLEILKLVVNTVKSALNYKVYEAKDNTAFAEAIAITEQLIAAQNKHKSKHAQLESKTYRALDKSDQVIRDFYEGVIKTMAAKVGKHGPTPKGTSIPFKIATGLVGYPYIVMSDDSVAKETRAEISSVLNFTLRGIAKELGSGALANEDLVEQVLQSKVNISKERRLAETFTIDWFENIWKSRDPSDKHWMSYRTREALTDVVLKADLSSLRLAKSLGFTDDPSSTQKILNLLGDDASAANERGILKSNIKRILKLSANSGAIRYAEELGRFIATGKTKGGISDNYMNAYSIAFDHLSENFTEEQVNLLDAFATLSAIDHLDKDSKVAVKGLSDREFNANAKENGMIDLLSNHINFKIKSRKDLFDGDPIQMVKGYIVERMDNLTDIKLGPSSDKEKEDNLGYSHQYPLGKIDASQTHDMLYINRNVPEVKDISGIMSTTNQRHMGTTLTEILMRNPSYINSKTGKPDFALIKSKIEGFKKMQGKLAKEFKIDDRFAFRPVRDSNNVITDYRAMMDHQSVKEMLRPDSEIQNVFAHMESSYTDRKATIENDKQTVNILIHEQLDLLEAHPDEFVDILDPTLPYIDRYRQLPQPIREYIQDFALDGKFMVREDIIDKVFGYKQLDITQMKLFAGEGFLTQRAKQIAGLVHYGTRETVGYGKNRIVLAMPAVVFGNMRSNIFQLLMRKIPMSYIYNKTIEGINEYSKYRRDNIERAKLVHLIETRNLNKETSQEALKVKRLDVRIERNRIHKMSEAGVDSLIVEDLNEAQIDGYWNRMKRTLFKGKYEEYGKLVPQSLQTLASWAFWTKGSAPYQASRQVVQMTDFIGRYVMIEHAMNVKGQEFKPALHDSLNAFVLFDESMIAALEALDVIGVTAFLSYYLRNTRSAKQMVQTSPTAVGISAMIQHATGVPTLGNINSSWLGGQFTPNLWQTDNLFDEANNLSAWEIGKDIKGYLIN